MWAKLLSQTVDRTKGEKDKADQLRPLLYPLIQTTIGALKLVPTARYFPLRFHLVRALVQLSESTGVYIHVSGFILDTLESVEMKRDAKPSSGRPIFFENMLKCPKSQIDTKHFQDAVLNQVCSWHLPFLTVACLASFAIPSLPIYTTTCVYKSTQHPCPHSCSWLAPLNIDYEKPSSLNIVFDQFRKRHVEQLSRQSYELLNSPCHLCARPAPPRPPGTVHTHAPVYVNTY